MSKRIQELAEQAFQPINDMASEGVADRHTFNQAWFQLYNQKFAELIVLECARWLGNREFASPEALKQHFGVKE